MHVTLVGGGWDPAAFPHVYAPFLDAAGSDAEASPRIATVVLDEGDGQDQLARWEQALRATGDCAPFPVLVPLGSTLDAAPLAGADGIFVCGGLSPAYADALAPVAGAVRELVERGTPYAGFSAGAAVAAVTAVVGGWRDGDVAVCPEDAGEGLDQVTCTPGLGLVPFAVDVHCAQWGTLPRLAAAVSTGSAGPVGCGIDEGTAVHVVDGRATVAGLGRVHRLERSAAGAAGVTLTAFGDGDRLPL